MVSIDTFRKLALSFPETTEEPHFDKTSFRVKNKIFATYDSSEKRASIKLSEIDQDVFSSPDKTIIYPVNNKWGKQGWTIIEMDKVKSELFVDALKTAYCEVAPKKLADQIRQENTNIEMDNITIEKTSLNDIDQLREIGRQTFYETFSDSNSEENMTNYLESSFSVEKINAELHDENAEFFFAKIGSKIIGYLKLNFGQSQTELKDNKALEIERIYVLKAFHGKKVGQILYDKAIEIAKNKRADYVWLGVWEENKRAISFYKKNGFVEFDKHIFKLGDDEQTDIMMKLKLKS
ncbi:MULTISPECIES: GNAT family N-acetyltransferase [unclassified Pedobacter]|uniref:GNAT family N-acetyltransferase n=1 Tax=unclassified Pedobacter TaxID=2628915 RepID=UPI001E5FF60D|nr:MULTISPECIES: GNAT family N-acetyltransferase [unclassified Pedobacter]